MPKGIFAYIRFKFIAGALFALILFFAAYADNWQTKISGGIFDFLNPVFGVVSKMKNFSEDLSFIIADKEGLRRENEHLREIVANLKGNMESAEIARKENDELRKMVGGSVVGEGNKILAAVILRPPEAVYNTLVVDAGRNSGIQEGMSVFSSGGVFLGRVAEVYDNTAKITLASYYGMETNVMFDELGLAAIAEGIGADSMRVKMPRAVEGIKIGDRVVTAGSVPRLVGFVEEIKTREADPFQTIIVRIPININYLKWAVVI